MTDLITDIGNQARLMRYMLLLTTDRPLSSGEAMEAVALTQKALGDAKRMARLDPSPSRQRTVTQLCAASKVAHHRYTNPNGAKTYA